MSKIKKPAPKLEPIHPSGVNRKFRRLAKFGKRRKTKPLAPVRTNPIKVQKPKEKK